MSLDLSAVIGLNIALVVVSAIAGCLSRSNRIHERKQKGKGERH